MLALAFQYLRRRHVSRPRRRGTWNGCANASNRISSRRRRTRATGASRFRRIRNATAASWRNNGRQWANQVAFFTLDSRLVRLPRWNGGATDEVVAFDEEFDVYYTVSEARRQVDVLARTLRPWGRVALLRVVRELAMEEAAADGGVFLHAAAFERDGIAYVIAGPKHAGKTTLLVHALDVRWQPVRRERPRAARAVRREALRSAECRRSSMSERARARRSPAISTATASGPTAVA